MFILPLANLPKCQVTSSPGWQGPMKAADPKTAGPANSLFCTKIRAGEVSPRSARAEAENFGHCEAWTGWSGASELGIEATLMKPRSVQGSQWNWAMIDPGIFLQPSCWITPISWPNRDQHPYCGALDPFLVCQKLLWSWSIHALRLMRETRHVQCSHCKHASYDVHWIH